MNTDDVRTGEVAPEVRRRLALVLDTDDLGRARALVDRLEPWFGVVKVGLELYAAAGPAAVAAFVDRGVDVFLDLKLHDIPTQVRRATTVLGRLGVSYLTLHTSGGEDMLRGGVEGLAAGAVAAGVDPAVALGVTVLTSDRDAPPELLRARVDLAATAGCGGVVCAASDLEVVRAAAPSLAAVVPGIRLAGTAADDQARPATPAVAIAVGASLLVVGRTVTAAGDPEAAAAAVASEVGATLAPA